MKGDKWYRLLHPKVAFLLLTQDSSGKVNVMTLAWAMPIDDEEKLLAISVWKETTVLKFSKKQRSLFFVSQLKKCFMKCGFVEQRAEKK